MEIIVDVFIVEMLDHRRLLPMDAYVNTVCFLFRISCDVLHFSTTENVEICET